jgi:hypothetical protein
MTWPAPSTSACADCNDCSPTTSGSARSGSSATTAFTKAAARATAGTSVNLTLLAAELSYSDQAHLTPDFTPMIGVPPAQYIKDQ